MKGIPGFLGGSLKSNRRWEQVAVPSVVFFCVTRKSPGEIDSDHYKEGIAMRTNIRRIRKHNFLNAESVPLRRANGGGDTAIASDDAIEKAESTALICQDARETDQWHDLGGEG
jgi:hypothetical protein